ncbi:hypothetical protein V493_01905 [Pseudogymnoascus sp. VKM F-4281 (FW-2241)]|nr:hypothetical protein V493_01905 [Pseudogymnoascus sp. VKM F-4281 (FW-2241)]
MYTDTKSSLAFVAAPARAEDAELSNLHRKLRIQKDRLTTWGLRWSEASRADSPIGPENADIDEALASAGLADVAGSVMATIKAVLAEAEPLWAASGRMEKAPMEKGGVVWDKGRFEDLVRDLTSSIDTLYDISRARLSEPPKKGRKIEIVVEEERAFEKTRMDAPRVIDPRELKGWVGAGVALQSDGNSLPKVLDMGKRTILYMTKQAPKKSWATEGEEVCFPVMLEFASYDPIYSVTGISPSMTRFEKLFAGLQRRNEEAGRPEFGVLNLIGYFEEENSRFGLVYELPARFPTTTLSNSAVSRPFYTRLADMMQMRAQEPPLEVRYRLAYNLATSVFDLHSKGVVHGNLAACNIAFFEQITPRADGEWVHPTVNVRRPYLTAYDLFPEPGRPADVANAAEVAWYRHELDPRLTPHTPLTPESRSLDLYSLAMLLVEIGLWSVSRDIRHGVAGIGIALDIKVETEEVNKQLAARCGTAYLRAVQACWGAVDDEISAVTRSDVVLQKVYGRVLSSLEKCCAIEEEEEEDVGDELLTGSLPSLSASPEISKSENRPAPSPSSVSLPRHALGREKPLPPPPPPRKKTRSRMDPEDIEINQMIQSLHIKPEPMSEKSQIALVEETTIRPKPKSRRFPNNEIIQEHLDRWHDTLMPQINHALRGFYRKYPESVEISLESIGETPQKTKPTILVVCTSVGKVKSILKRHFSYDSTTYGLMVCRGKVMRSRKRAAKRSMARDEEYVEPKNSHHQERPVNGASIGAFAEGQALMPVSFGGLVMVDGEPFGLTVHHMLDVPSDSECDDDDYSPPTIRSSDIEPGPAPLTTEALEALGYELSDCDSETSSIASSIFSEESSAVEPGDIGGIEPDCAGGYLVTQPALDDVDPRLFPSADTMTQDYLDSYTLGPLHASSGLRRRACDLGLTHEIDWALFRFSPGREPGENKIAGAPAGWPGALIPTAQLGGLSVRAVARTSGVTQGRIQRAVTTVKFRGRQTPSQSFTVEGGLGVPGDSGAWVLADGGACGHVLAWSEKRRVGYFCPMEIIFADIKGTLGAGIVEFPGVTEVEAGDGNEDEAMLELEEVQVPGDKEKLDEVGLSVYSFLKGGQVKDEVEDVDLVTGMEGMCVRA